MKITKITFLVLFFLGKSIILSQENSTNKFITVRLKLIKKTKVDSLKCIFYNEISKKLGLLKQTENQEKFADTAIYFAKKSNNASLLIRSITSKINAAIVKQDTAFVYKLFREGLQISKERNLSKIDNDFLRFKIRNIYYSIRQGIITSEAGLKEYTNLYKEIKLTNKHEIITELVGRISLLYRNRKELGKALNYNSLELEYAAKSKNAQKKAAAKITELDISYQLIPRPIKSEDVLPLIQKAKEAEAFMKKHEILDILPFAQLYLAKFYIHETSFKKAEDVLNAINDSLPVRVVFSKYEQLCEIAKSTNN
ncbi:MAG TPA: hypothetical protein ENK75_00655 [Saprospiraceae bacterium]|nr:hypothetical protein [Saprospiraceae bacterium]